MQKSHICIAVVLTVYKAWFYFAKAEQCQPSGQWIALKNVGLDVILIEPEGIKSAKFLKALHTERLTRLTTFVRELSRDFKHSSFTMLQARSLTDDPFGCLTKPVTNVTEFAKAVGSKEPNTAALIMKAAAITPKYLETFKTSPAPSAADTSAVKDITDRTVRLIVMFAEDYAAKSSFLDSITDVFTMLESSPETCQSENPSQQQVQREMSNRKIDLLLVTPAKALRTKWSQTFELQDALLYPYAKALTPGSLEAVTSEAMAVAEFVRERAIASACKRFTELTAKSEKDAATVTPTPPKNKPTPPKYKPTPSKNTPTPVTTSTTVKTTPDSATVVVSSATVTAQLVTVLTTPTTAAALKTAKSLTNQTSAAVLSSRFWPMFPLGILLAAAAS